MTPALAGRGVRQPAIDEDAFVRLAQEHDVDAFNRLVELHQDRVFSVMVRMVRDRSRAEDLTQEAFIAAFQSIGKFRGGSFQAWLLRIAKNAAIDAIRRTQRRPEVSMDQDIVTLANTLPAAGQGPEEAALQQEVGAQIAEGLGELPADQRLAVVLVDIEGYSYEEAAEVMEVSQGTLKSRLNRGRTRLREYLQARPELLPARFRL